MDFLKEHSGVRMVIILVSFILAVVLVISGWKLAGEMAGLLRMIVGLAFLLVALGAYNIVFADKKKNRR